MNSNIIGRQKLRLVRHFILRRKIAKKLRKQAKTEEIRKTQKTDETPLEEKLGYTFSDRRILRLALTHRSCGVSCNERLEFLGDSILALVISEYLYSKYPAMNEGELSCVRSGLVSKITLVSCAEEMDLLPHILLGRSERKGQSLRSSSSVMANALEAIIGAVYLDGGPVYCRDVVIRFYGDRLKNVECINSFKDAKSKLQELLQARYRSVPLYKLITTRGKPHDRIFVVGCSVPSCDEEFVGEGSSRKGADQVAAALALEYLVAD